MPRYRLPKTFPKDGSSALAYIDFKDDDPAPGWCVVRWVDDGRGFNLGHPEGGGWNVRGLVAWTPLPKPPIRSTRR